MSSSEKQERPGLSFERAVASVQSKMAPDASVTHNEYLIDNLGHRRQFDVVIRARTAGHAILGVIECKDLQRRVGTPDIDAFVTKARDVNANLTLLVSRRGFTKPAIERATHYGIGTMSLLADDSLDCGFRVGGEWYAELYRWKQFGARITCAPGYRSPENFDLKDILYSGLPARNWFLDHLRKNMHNEERLGWYWIDLTFRGPVPFTIAGQEIHLRALRFLAERVLEKKRRFVQFTGDGFINWADGSVILPPQTQVVSDTFRADLSDWDDYEGDIPARRGDWDWNMKVFAVPQPDRDIPHLHDL